MTDEDLKIIRAMERYGSGFEGKLAELCYVADSSNMARIKATWPWIFEQWETAVKQDERRARDEKL